MLQTRFKKYKFLLLLLPIVIYLSLILIGGIGPALLQSLGYFPSLGLNTITLSYYKDIVSNPTFLNSLSFSLYTSIVSSALSVLLGFILALLTVQSGDKGSKIARLFRVPVAVPHIVVVLMLMTMFSKAGILARIINTIFPNINTDFLSNVLYNKHGLAVIIVYLWKEIPFVAMTTYSVLNNLDKSLGLAATNLGASKLNVLIHIIIPLSLPTVFSSFIIVLAYSFGAYEVPWLVGPTTPKALPIQAYIEYTNASLLNRPYAMAYNILILIIAIIPIIVFMYAFNRLNRRSYE